jgi:hypothetical protein
MWLAPDRECTETTMSVAATKMTRRSGFDPVVVDVVRAAYRLSAMEENLRRHRTEPRIRLRTICQLSQHQPVGGTMKVEHSGYTRDISGHGIGVLTTTELRKGTVLWIGFPELGNPAFVFQLQVTNCRQLLPELYRVGARIVGNPEKPFLDSLGGLVNVTGAPTA